MKITKKKIIWSFFVILLLLVSFSIYYLFFSSIEKDIVFYNSSNRNVCLFEVEYCNKKVIFKDIKPDDSKISEVTKFSRFRCFVDDKLKYNISFDCENFENNGSVFFRNLKYYIYSSFSY